MQLLVGVVATSIELKNELKELPCEFYYLIWKVFETPLYFNLNLKL
jgi:hypothetical protein